MKISEFKTLLQNTTALELALSSGGRVPPHFHITEAGLSTKHFIDCGGTIRKESAVNFQVLVGSDVDHRLAPSKLEKIITKAEKLWQGEDPEVEVEYQGETLGKYALRFEKGGFSLEPKHTACLAAEQCGIPEKSKAGLSDLKTSASSCCTPASGCCN